MAGLENTPNTTLSTFGTATPERPKETLPEATPLDIEKFRREIKEEFRKEIDGARIRYTGVLGAFVAFFTFISIEFQLITSFNYQSFFFFSIFFAGILILFTLLLHTTLNKEYGFKTILLTCLSLIAIISAFFYLEHTGIAQIKNSRQEKNQILNK